MQIAHGEWQARKEEVHAAQLAAGELQLRTQGLVDRLRDEHQIDLIEESKNRRSGPARRNCPRKACAEEEIEELRRKLSRLGAVNLDSLQELAELELRARRLARAIRRSGGRAEVAHGHHHDNQRRQPALVRRDVFARPRQLSGSCSAGSLAAVRPT